MVHYYDHIKNFGSPNGLCLSITESKHIAAVKCSWRQSNKHAALPQMLKINKRLNKLAAARADFIVCGMLADSCLIWASRAALSGEDLMDDDGDDDGDDSGESNDPTPDKIDALNHDHPLDNTGAHTLSSTNAHTPGIDDNHPHPIQDSSTLPDDEDKDDHGPVESGPLMNEVRLARKKGQVFSPCGSHKP